MQARHSGSSSAGFATSASRPTIASHTATRIFGAPNLGENPRDDVEGRRDWWAD
jgi:hypothetical protein